jgi:hemerythrin-like metal-binding protein
MSVGVPRLDRDHRVLIGLINRLAGERSPRPDDKVVGEVLEALVAYTVFHFAREEQVMEACGFAELETHREEHRLLAGEVTGLHARFLRDRQSVGYEDLLRFLTDWLNHHILLQDVAYRSAVGDGGEAERVARAFGEFDVGSVAARAGVGDLIDAD